MTAKKQTERVAAPPAIDKSDAERIHDVVRAIPRGHRVAARALQRCPAGLPWQRVLAKKDARRAWVSIQEPKHAQAQRELLAREGVRFDAGGFIVLRDFGWLPT